MDSMIRIQILDKAVCISRSGNAVMKGMKPFVLPPHSQLWINIRADVVLLVLGRQPI